VTNESTPPGGQYQEAIDGYRKTASWLLSSFGALGAALIAGAVPLSSLTESVGWRKPIALICLAIALASILLVVSKAVALIAPQRGSYRDFGADLFAALRKDLERDNTPLKQAATSATDLAEKYDSALETLRRCYFEYREAWLAGDPRATGPANGGVGPSLEELYTDAKEYSEELEEIVVRVTWLGLVLNTRKLFSSFVRGLYVAIAVAAASTVAFFVIAVPPEKAPAPPPKVAVTVSEPQTCAGLYLTLDELVQHAPQIADKWPAAKLGEQAKECGFADRNSLSQFLHLLAGR
jgi:hypothetical protein